MKKIGFVVCVVAFIASGAVMAFAGYRLLANFHEARSGAVASGSASEPDLTYQKLPADSSADWLTTFTLTERGGKQVQWEDLGRQVRVVSFFFSSCPANCLQENFKVREIQQAYAGKEVRFVSITCDPDIDTPERLREYANKLSAPTDQWLFLTGRLSYIRRVAAATNGETSAAPSIGTSSTKSLSSSCSSIGSSLKLSPQPRKSLKNLNSAFHILNSES
jgi:cytochrome oxidase Cu insertion factor (SCO1/SenC/PrrC family)